MKTLTHTNRSATVPCSRWVTSMNISWCSSSQRWQPLARHHWFTSIQSVALSEHATKREQLDGTVRLINEPLSALQHQRADPHHYLLYRSVSGSALHRLLTSSRYGQTELKECEIILDEYGQQDMIRVVTAPVVWGSTSPGSLCALGKIRRK